MAMFRPTIFMEVYMATTRLMPLHAGKGRSVATALGKTTDYVENPEKTDGGEWISSYECDPMIADEEFLLSKRQYAQLTGRDQGERDVIAYHLRQSFKPGEIDPATANKIGYDLAMSLTKGKHAFVVCTHVDKQHIHSHIIFNSTALDCTKKFRNFWGSSFAIRKISDRLCVENGLSIIEKPKQSRGSYGTWIGDDKQPTLRENLAKLIDANLEQSLTLEELKDALRNADCEVKHKAHLAVKLPQGKRFIRCDSLGENYTEHALLKRLGCEQVAKPTAKKKALSPAGKKPNLLIDIEAKLQQGKGVGYEKWAKTFNLKESAKTLIYLQENGLDDYEVLSVKAKDASQRFDMISDKIKASEKRLSEITGLQKHIGTYRKTRDIYVQYRQSGYSKKFLAAHESDILLHKVAKQEFDKLGLEKLPSIDTLKMEYATLFSQKNKLYGEYKQARQEMVDLQMAKHNIDRILNVPQQAKTIKSVSHEER